MRPKDGGGATEFGATGYVNFAEKSSGETFPHNIIVS